MENGILSGMRRLLAALFLAACASWARADGYVVRAEKGSVYLDLLAADGASIGRKFVVYTEGAELKHPVTGKSMGKIEQRVADGEIRELTPQYSIGKLSDPAAAAAEGQKVRWDSPGAPVAPVAPVAAPPTSGAPTTTKRPAWRSPNAKLETVDLELADVDGDGKPDFVLADGNKVMAYPADAATKVWEAFCSFEGKDTGIKFLSLEASDLNGDGRAEVFATYHNDFLDRVETLVLDCKGGKFEKLALLPWMVRGIYDGAGKRSLSAQSLLPDRVFPFGGMFPLVFAEGKYQLGAPQLHAKRVDWGYSFARTGQEGTDAPATIYYEHGGHLRAQFEKDHWTSPEQMGQTSNRVRWHDRVLRFAPRLPVAAENGSLSAVYAVRNFPRLGSLADAFGIYSRGEVQRMRWNGLSLETEWTGEADGYVAGVTVADALYVAVVGANGSTSVWKFAQ